MSQNPESEIDDAKVMLTLIKAPADTPFGKRVTKARNHQNPVQTANFASLDDNQERLRQEIALLDFTYQYRPEVSESGDRVIPLEEALRALASCQDDPRYASWLKREPARLSNPDSSEYQAIFKSSLSGLTLVNAVLFHRAIRTLMVGYEQQAPVRSLEKLVYRHSVNVVASVMMKCLRKRIAASEIPVEAVILSLISEPLDRLRQQTIDLARKHLLDEGPLAYFRNHGSVSIFLAELMEIHFDLKSDETVSRLKAKSFGDDSNSRTRLMGYLLSKAPQI